MKTKRVLIQAPNQRSHSRVSLARALSKLGYCSRVQAQAFIEAGRVQVNGAIQRKIEFRLDPNHDRIEVDGQRVTSPVRIYLMLNKPRGVVTTRSDEKERKTVYDCLADRDFFWLFPVGRLDKASQGLLLFTNDTRWAAGLTDRESHVDKTYHVQVDCLADENLRQRLIQGFPTPDGGFLQAKAARLLRRGGRNSWLEIVLDEGRNRHIRRLLSDLGVNVLRLVRVSIGPLKLGNLAKGAFRHLTAEERKSLARASKQSRKEL